MTGSLPKELRDRVRSSIWNKADELDWQKLSDMERATWYEYWSKDKDIGGVLARFMDPRKVRVYIKDSLLKPYRRARLEGGIERVFSSVGIDLKGIEFARAYDKPHGRELTDGRVICWGNSRDWKLVLFAVAERSYDRKSRSGHAAILFETGQTATEAMRLMVSYFGASLGIEKIVWLE